MDAPPVCGGLFGFRLRLRAIPEWAQGPVSGPHDRSRQAAVRQSAGLPKANAAPATRTQKILFIQRFERKSPRALSVLSPCFAARLPLSGASAALSLSTWKSRSVRQAAWGHFLMANVVVVGSQWGDEGKGKIVDWLSEQADIVVRFQGGHNAGHTLVINGTTYKLSLLPSGVVRPGKLSVIGNGVVLDPQALLDEIKHLKTQNVSVTPENLRIAENATLILPLHRELDAIRESASAALRIGTTRRGIGPAYEDKVGRRAIRLMDLADGATLDRKIDRLLTHHNALRKGLGLDALDGGEVRKYLETVAPAVLPYMDSVWSLLDQKRREGKRILFEGAQGALLEVDHGTYPFVTSSNT